MKKIAFLIWCFISLVLVLQINAQCSNQLPTKPWGDNRPATECELLFYRNNYPIIIKAFNKMEVYFANNYTADILNPNPKMGMEDWDASTLADKKYIHNFNVGIGSEKNFFQDLQNLNWTYSIKADDDAYSKAYNELANIWGEKGMDAYVRELLAKVGFDNMGKDSLMCKAAMLNNELVNKFIITTNMQGINITEDKFEYTHANFELLNTQNCAYAIRVIKNKVITNAGDAEQADKNNHIDELHLYIGKWKAPQITISKGFVVQNNFNLSQSKLSVQNILVVIKCAPELQDEVLKHIDFEQLNKLILQ